MHNKFLRIILCKNIIGFILLISLVHPPKYYSQSKYGFNFDSNWNWEELIEKVVLINPYLIKSVDYLKNNISIEDARIILKELSQLDSLKELLKLSKITKSDSKEEYVKWDSLFSNSFDSLIITEDFSGLISTAIVLTKLKTANHNNLFEFINRVYLPQPVREHRNNIEINFDWSGAEKVLEYYNSDTMPQNEVFGSEPYKVFLNDNSNDFNIYKNLKYFLNESSKKNTLYSIYKWVNPESFWNFGGVSIYRNNFKDVISSIKENERNMRVDIATHLAIYLPDSIFLKVNVNFLFGTKNSDFHLGNMLGINLERFGNNYAHLIRFIIHQIFKIAQEEIQLPIDEFVVNDKDKEFIKLLSNILENGTANYVGPIGTETRPWYLLEKDFKLFNTTFRYIYKKNSKHALDSLINLGYSGDAPFYTMGTQIAYIIETTLGRNALIRAIEYGPVAFFSKYIESYKEYSDKIRNVFRFSKKLEQKISKLKSLFPDYVLKDALKLKKYRSDTTILSERIKKFVNTHIKKENPDLIYFLSAQILLEANEFESAKRFFLKGIQDKKDKGILSGKIGQAFLKRHALIEALEFFNLYVETSFSDAKAYELRGNYFYKLGETEKAKNDYEKAMRIDTSLNLPKSFLMK